MQDCNLGLGLWQGRYRDWEGRWLRWYDAAGEWMLTGEEQERQRADRLAAKLQAIGVDPDGV